MEHVIEYIKRKIERVFIILSIFFYIILTIVPVSAKTMSYDQIHRSNSFFHDNFYEVNFTSTTEMDRSLNEKTKALRHGIICLEQDVSYAAKTGTTLLNVEQRSLQHMFTRHANDFEVTGNWSKAAATEFEEVLRTHMVGLTPIQGTYRGSQQVLHYFNSSTGLNVMTDMSGNLVGGWRLSADQIKYLLSTGTVK